LLSGTIVFKDKEGTISIFDGPPVCSLKKRHPPLAPIMKYLAPIFG